MALLPPGLGLVASPSPPSPPTAPSPGFSPPNAPTAPPQPLAAPPDPDLTLAAPPDPDPAPPAPSAAASVATNRALGFHRVGATSHVARLPAAQAAELLHRRAHIGVDKIRHAAHTTADAPKNLASASATTRTSSCTSCAAARIRRAAHPGTLSAPAPEPGVLHYDLKELVLSVGLCRCGVGGGKHLFKDCPKSKEKAAKKAKKDALAAAPPIPGLLPSDAMAAISALLSQIVVNGGAVAGTGVESKSDSAYTFLRHRAPTPSRSTSVPPGTMNSVRAQHGVLNQCTGSTRRLGTSSPHNAARSPLFRLIAPSTVDLPYRGQWLPPLDGATERVLLASDKLTAAELRGARRSHALAPPGPLAPTVAFSFDFASDHSLARRILAWRHARIRPIIHSLRCSRNL